MANKCTACGASIKWIKTTAGKWMPCCEPSVKIRIEDVGTDSFVTEDGRIVRGTFDGDTEAWVPHWVVCPAAGTFRRRTRK